MLLFMQAADLLIFRAGCGAQSVHFPELAILFVSALHMVT